MVNSKLIHGLLFLVENGYYSSLDEAKDDAYRNLLHKWGIKLQDMETKKYVEQIEWKRVLDTMIEMGLKKGKTFTMEDVKKFFMKRYPEVKEIKSFGLKLSSSIRSSSLVKNGFIAKTGQFEVRRGQRYVIWIVKKPLEILKRQISE
jgi:hypothetical protein